MGGEGLSFNDGIGKDVRPVNHDNRHRRGYVTSDFEQNLHSFNSVTENDEVLRADDAETYFLHGLERSETGDESWDGDKEENGSDIFGNDGYVRMSEKTAHLSRGGSYKFVCDDAYESSPDLSDTASVGIQEVRGSDATAEDISESVITNETEGSQSVELVTCGKRNRVSFSHAMKVHYFESDERNGYPQQKRKTEGSYQALRKAAMRDGAVCEPRQMSFNTDCGLLNDSRLRSVGLRDNTPGPFSCHNYVGLPNKTCSPLHKGQEKLPVVSVYTQTEVGPRHIQDFRARCVGLVQSPVKVSLQSEKERSVFQEPEVRLAVQLNEASTLNIGLSLTGPDSASNGINFCPSHRSEIEFPQTVKVSGPQRENKNADVDPREESAKESQTKNFGNSDNLATRRGRYDTDVETVSLFGETRQVVWLTDKYFSPCLWQSSDDDDPSVLTRRDIPSNALLADAGRTVSGVSVGFQNSLSGKLRHSLSKISKMTIFGRSANMLYLKKRFKQRFTLVSFSGYAKRMYDLSSPKREKPCGKKSYNKMNLSDGNMTKSGWQTWMRRCKVACTKMGKKEILQRKKSNEKSIGPHTGRCPNIIFDSRGLIVHRQIKHSLSEMFKNLRHSVRRSRNQNLCVVPSTLQSGLCSVESEDYKLHNENKQPSRVGKIGRDAQTERKILNFSKLRGEAIGHPSDTERLQRKDSKEKTGTLQADKGSQTQCMGSCGRTRFPNYSCHDEHKNFRSCRRHLRSAKRTAQSLQRFCRKGSGLVKGIFAQRMTLRQRSSQSVKDNKAGTENILRHNDRPRYTIGSLSLLEKRQGNRNPSGKSYGMFKDLVKKLFVNLGQRIN